MFEIIPGLYLAQLPMIIGPTKEENLRKYQIKRVLTVSLERIPAISQLDDIDYQFVCLFDLPDQEILSNGLLFDALDYIETSIEKNENVVVHCVAAVSRSVMVCTAYLMSRNKWSLNESLRFIKKIRHAAGPNEGFLAQLKIWERSQLSRDTELYKSSKIQIPHYTQGPAYLYRQPVENVNYKIRFKCRSCRKLLFHADNIIHKISDSSSKCQKYLIEPMEWLTVVDRTCNIIHTCGAKLGVFNAAGSKCSNCYNFVLPWIFIDKSKIDKIDVENAK